ncbi:SRPBCC family protein [Schaalia suimastitidis]|uniref:SRPBCC family protein n=1 Tax=Schaalia suimastitidis TaxID=121163 RepID=UPI0004272A20|nr:SRPBCC family protein [Schaalia suimastitidis]
MATFSVTRSATIPASIDTVRALIRDLHEWEKWSPWQDIDSQMTQTYSGADAGVGARMEWSGNKEAGSGRMTVVTDTPELIEVDVEFLKPFKALNRSHFTLAVQGEESTVVTWEMTGKQNLLMKVMFSVMKMDGRIGADFERGLARLAEAAAN